MEKRRRGSLIFMGLLLLSLIISQTESEKVEIPVGVILDLNSSLGNTTVSSTNIALQNFYATHDHYKTRIKLYFNHSGNDVLTAASAGWHLMYEQNVSAILGPQTSEQARYVVDLGYASDVPVIWFSPSGPSLFPPRTRFFLEDRYFSYRSHCSQFEAIAAIIKAYNWHYVIPIYEDPEFGYDLILCLTYALQDMDTRVPHISAISKHYSDANITHEIHKINTARTHVFIAHMTLELWSRFMKFAENEGLLQQNYVWILTQGLSSVLNPKALNMSAIGYMDGALGVKPSLDDSDIDNRTSLSAELMSLYGKAVSLYELWAYDTITALAIAVENANLADYDVLNRDLHSITGRRLEISIEKTNFSGMSGNFSLSQRQLEQAQFEVYNVNGTRENIIGYWRPETRLVLKDGVKVKWPGNPDERPPKLRFGVPTKAHFTEFVNVIGEGQDSKYTGLAVEVFENVIQSLPFRLPYEFVPVDNTNGYDDEFLCNMTDKGVDAIIGDITIVMNRTKCVDFTMPYLDSSVSMVVKVRSDSKNSWILLKPFDWKLWLILAVIFVVATVIVIILERRTKDDDESKFKQFIHNPFLVYMSDVDDLKSGTSKWVVIVVMFVLTIAMQVYTANLTATLSERVTTKPFLFKDLQEIKRNNKAVGYQNNSWVRELLIQQVRLKDHQLQPLGNYKDYETALSNEDKKEGVSVDAIFDETPYLLLFLNNCSSCKMTGPIYKAGGFAFAFPKNSTLVSYFSAAILKVTQNVTLFRDMKNNIHLPISIDKTEYRSDVEMRSLTLGDFGGLFPIAFSVLALFFIFAILKVPYSVAMLKKVPPIAFVMEKVLSFAAWSHNKFVSFLSPSGGVIVIKS